ncbi:MAG: Na/Pi cotransporter family protein [Oligoflexus sp.]
MIASIMGGAGLFLLGMMLLSENLQAAASNSLRTILQRMTYNPISSVITGTSITSILQSSSATLLITLGLVNAGIISFTNSLGIIYGANLGTTSTAWIVSLLGFKLSMSNLALPLIGVGSLVRIFVKGVLGHIALAAAGFGLIFLGIDLLQEGMSNLAAKINFQDYNLHGVSGYLLLLILGILLAIALQSSSAAMVTTLAALYAGAITLPQAAVLVIGQNIGTTATAGIGAIGASIAAKRTALAHFLFNMVTAMVAFLLLPLLMYLSNLVSDRFFGGGAAISLAAFHLLFNLIGVMIALPLTHPFSRLICSLIAEKPLELTRRLDRSKFTDSEADLDALRLTIDEIAHNLFDLVGRLVASGVQRTASGLSLQDMRIGIEECYRYIQVLRSDPNNEASFQNQLRLLHALSHLDQIARISLEQQKPLSQYHLWEKSWQTPFRPTSTYFESNLHQLANTLAKPLAELDSGWKNLENDFTDFKQQHRNVRKFYLSEAAKGSMSPDQLMALIDANRTIETLAFHCWRFASYFHTNEVPLANFA